MRATDRSHVHVQQKNHTAIVTADEKLKHHHNFHKIILLNNPLRIMRVRRPRFKKIDNKRQV